MRRLLIAALGLAFGASLPAVARADLAGDLEQSCQKVENPGPGADPLRYQMFGQVLACATSNYWSERYMSDPKKKSKRIRKRKPKLRNTDWPVLETRYLLTELDKLALAQLFIGLKTEGRSLERKLGEAIVFRTVHRNIDSAALMREIAAAPFLVGGAKDLIRDIYTEQRLVASEWDAVLDQEREAARLFALADERFRAWTADGRRNRALAERMAALSSRMNDGQKPTVAECEAPLMEDYIAKVKSLRMEHPLLVLAAHIMNACGNVRGDDSFKRQFDAMIPPGAEAVGLLGTLEDEVNRALVEMANQGGRPGKLRPARAIQYDYASKAPVQFMRSPATTGLQPGRGAMKIRRLTPTRYKGLDYVLVEGEGMTLDVPVMDCQSRQEGWRVDGNNIVPRTVTACSPTGKMQKETIEVGVYLVPRLFASALKKGHWARLRLLSVRAGVNPDESQFDPVYKGETVPAAPVVVGRTLDELTKKGGLQVTLPDRKPLL